MTWLRKKIECSWGFLKKHDKDLRVFEVIIAFLGGIVVTGFVGWATVEVSRRSADIAQRSADIAQAAADIGQRSADIAQTTARISQRGEIGSHLIALGGSDSRARSLAAIGLSGFAEFGDTVISLLGLALSNALKENDEELQLHILDSFIKMKERYYNDIILHVNKMLIKPQDKFFLQAAIVILDKIDSQKIVEYIDQQERLILGIIEPIIDSRCLDNAKTVLDKLKNRAFREKMLDGIPKIMRAIHFDNECLAKKENQLLYKERDMALRENSWQRLLIVGRDFALEGKNNEALQIFQMTGEIARKQGSWEGLFKAGQGAASIHANEEAEIFYKEAQAVAKNQEEAIHILENG